MYVNLVASLSVFNFNRKSFRFVLTLKQYYQTNQFPDRDQQQASHFEMNLDLDLKFLAPVQCSQLLNKKIVDLEVLRRS